MKKIVRSLAAVGAGLSLMASGAQAQQLFTGSGCSGDQFLFCASWTFTWVDNTHMSLFITNTSQNAPANNTNSAITQIAIGNVTLPDPTGISPAVTGWTYESSVNGFNGFGLLENQFGSITSNGVNNALLDGQSQTFTFLFGGAGVTFANAQTAVSGAQIAIHDQGAPNNCASSKGVMLGAVSGQNTSDLECGGGGTSTVPEPSTYALMAAGLAGLFVASRRRRAA